jgi:hypothetical protein
MKFAVSIIVMLFLMLLCSTTYGLGITPSVVGNDQFLKGWVGFGDPNVGMVGPYVTWNDLDPTNIWAGGVRGQLDLSGTVQAGISRIIPVPASWWETLEMLHASAYGAVEVGACHLIGGPEAETTPLLGARLGPLVVEVGYAIFDGGKIASADKVIAESGLTWWVGLQWPMRF